MDNSKEFLVRYCKPPMTSLISKQGTPLNFVCNLLFCEEICLSLIKQVVSIPLLLPVLFVQQRKSSQRCQVTLLPCFVSDAVECRSSCCPVACSPCKTSFNIISENTSFEISRLSRDKCWSCGFPPGTRKGWESIVCRC